MKLSPLRQRFADEYLIDLNATQAYLRAGYKVNPKVASVNSSRLLANAKIQAYIQVKRQKAEAKLDTSFERVLLEFARIAFLDTRSMFDAAGMLKPIQELSDDAAHAISSIEVVEEFNGRDQGKHELVGYVKKYRMVSKNQALENLCKMLGYYAPEKIKLDATIEHIDAREKLSSLITRLASRVEAAGSAERN